MSDLQIGIPVLTAGTVTLVLNTGSPDTLEISTATIWRSSEGVWAIGRGHDIVLFIGAATHTAKIRDVIWTGTAARVELRWLGARPSAGASGLAYELYQSTVAKSLFAAWIDNLRRVITKGDTTNPVTVHAFQGGGKRYAIEAAAGGLALRGGNDTVDWPALPFLDNMAEVKPTETVVAAMIGTHIFNVKRRFNLTGDLGDAAKINAGQGLINPGQTAEFPAGMTIPVATPITWLADSNIEFASSVMQPQFSGGTASTEDVFILAPPGGVRTRHYRGYRCFGAAGGGTGGRHAFSVRGPMLQNLFEEFSVYAGENPNGYDFHISGTRDPAVPHWNVLDRSVLGLGGAYHGGADGWKFHKLGAIGRHLITLDTVPGAFLSEVTGSTGKCSHEPVRVWRGSEALIFNNSFEFDAPNLSADSTTISVIPQYAGLAGQIDGLRIIKNNFGGSAFINRSIYMAAGASKVVNTFIDENTFNETATNVDVLIANADVIRTRIGTGNLERRAASGTFDPGWEVRVVDNGTETMGVWKPVSGMGLVNGWTASAGARLRVCPYTNMVQGEGVLIPGTRTPGTTIFTAPSGMRPRAFFYGSVATNNGTGTRDLVLLDSGVVAVGNTAFAGTALPLTTLMNFPVVAKPTYISRL